MKRCPDCGKEYLDDVTVCPFDGMPVVHPQEHRETVPSPAATPNAFNIRLISPISSAGSYQVLVERHGETIKCEFAPGGEVNNAIHLLAPLLHATLCINPHWNAAEARFEKK